VKKIDYMQLQPGDILLTTSLAAESWSIRAGTKSDISHAMLYVSSTSVIDSTGDGVHARNLQKMFYDDKCAIHALRPKDPLTADQLTKATPRLCNCLACRFGFSDLEIEQARKPALELQSVLTRHAVLLWSLWLLRHDPEAHERLVKPIAPLHHPFIKDILAQYGREATVQARRDSLVRGSSSQIRDGRVAQLH
jgi:hypothetical protein